jgi:hypothetical protein
MLIQIYSRLHVRCLICVLIDIFSMTKNSIPGLKMMLRSSLQTFYRNHYITKYPYLKSQWICYFLRRCFISSITAKTLTGLNYIYRVDKVEWSRALDVRLSGWCCSVSMVWVQIPSREEQKLFGLIFRRIYYMLFSYQTGYIMWHSRFRIYIPLYNPRIFT